VRVRAGRKVCPSARFAGACRGGRVMSMQEELMVLWVFTVVIVATVVSHVASYLAFALQNFFA